MQTANVNVPVKVTGRHVSVTEPIKDYATSRIEHLHLDYPRIIEAHVILDVEKHRHFAEIILHCTNHISIEASAETDDMYASIDGVVAKIAHKTGARGDVCVDCHMPTTIYMQRHVRHDHGFTIPDPRLTKELGIPNACNRCHTDKTADWSLDALV